MKLYSRVIISILVCMVMLIQAGCWDMKLYEEIGFILQFGFENGPDGELIISMTTPVVMPDAEKTAEILTIDGETLIRSAREKLRNQSGKMLQGGKAQHVVFSEELAKSEGIFGYLQVFIRNPENPMLANVVVVKGSPKEMMELSLDYVDKPRPAYYIAYLLQDAHRRNAIPDYRVFNFSIDHYSGTIDPVTPYMTYDDKSLEVIGSAVFSGDKMTGSIDIRQSMLLNCLIGNKEAFEYIYEGMMPGEDKEVRKEGAAFMVRNSKRSIDIDTGGEVPVVNIRMRLKAIMDEYSGEERLIKPEVKAGLEEIFEQDIEKQTIKLLKYLQSVGSDPVGFGELVRAYDNKYWKTVDWREVYKDAEFRVDVDMILEFYGAIE